MDAARDPAHMQHLPCAQRPRQADHSHRQ
jgi:hypothetical protein